MNNQGWQCPNCNRVNAPWYPFCDCRPQERTISMKEIQQKCNQEWYKTEHTPGDLEMICSKCGVNGRDVPITGGWL